MRQLHKYHGAGNTFILIEDFKRDFPSQDTSRIAQLCASTIGAGTDGLILLQASQIADFRMSYFNADGSSASMCANGLRCLVQLLIDLQYLQPFYQIETPVGVLKVTVRAEKIFTQLSTPKILFWKKPMKWEGAVFTGYGVDTGVPHLVFIGLQLDPMQFLPFTKFMRWQENANVNLVQVLAPNEIAVRTYERGVEAETLSCGTGAAACALVATRLFDWEGTVRVKTLSSNYLEVDLQEGVTITGPATRMTLQPEERERLLTLMSNL